MTKYNLFSREYLGKNPQSDFHLGNFTLEKTIEISDEDYNCDDDDELISALYELDILMSDEEDLISISRQNGEIKIIERFFNVPVYLMTPILEE